MNFYFDPTMPNIEYSYFHSEKYDFKETYKDAKEVMSLDIKYLRGQ